MKAVDWKARAERLAKWARMNTVAFSRGSEEVGAILNQAEREHPGTNQPGLYPLFEHMFDGHGLTLTDSELNEIVHVVASMRSPYVVLGESDNGAHSFTEGAGVEPVKTNPPTFEVGQWVGNIHNGLPYRVASVDDVLIDLPGLGGLHRDMCAPIPPPVSDEWMREHKPGWRLTGRVEDCGHGSNNFVSVLPNGTACSIWMNTKCCEYFDGYRWTIEKIPQAAPCPTTRDIIEKEREEQYAAFMADKLVMKESLDLAHRQINSLFGLMSSHGVSIDRLKAFEESVELRFQSLAEFVELVGQWAEKEKQSRGGH